ncbi:conjugal transfer protein TraD [Brucella sp. NBRC 12950]|uniref:conjugal transfer protein TraD n=1 Tax=Brucella sp. NBRC 12950 TaxID=2994518 RepID=UPI00249FC808|nr:conjugal transfer protein TraD [Brucella sp. NBRC 12950]GLU29879.1 conjugal transfer protein TraD [Brucella sp. NBRC 12950]
MLKKSDRSKDAHEKIQLGGLVVKAGLREADKAFLLGVLVMASQQLHDEVFVRDMTALGKQAFAHD